MRGRLLVILVAAVAVVVAAVYGRGGGDSGSKTSPAKATTTAAPAGSLVLKFAYSPEKEQLLGPVIRGFNSSGEQVDGRRVFVQGEVRASGEAETLIARGRLKPELWSPASSFWGRLLALDADRPYAPDDSPSIVRTPLVIAMWEELARAYGWPKRTLSYKQLAELATRGWGAVGRPEFGSFKYVHTNPDFSTSGLSAVAASYYAATGKKEGLTEADVQRPAVRSQVRAIERSIVHYGDTTLFIADEMRRHGLGYASAVAMEEATLLDFNRKAHGSNRLVALYPSDGTFFSDNPLITLDAPWVDAGERKAAAAFASYVHDHVDAQAAGRYGFRPADPAAKPAGLVTAANGADPGQPQRVLRVPEPLVLRQIKNAWRGDRKPANVLLVLDNSGSMGEEGKLGEAKRGLATFLTEVSDDDSVGLATFSHTFELRVPVAKMLTNRARLRSALDTVFPDNDTRLNDSAVDAVNMMERVQDKSRITAVVLLTDGLDTASQRRGSDAITELERQGRKENGPIRLFTIAYGHEPDKKLLGAFADATGGKGFAASTADIEAVYRSISSFF